MKDLDNKSILGTLVPNRRDSDSGFYQTLSLLLLFIVLRLPGGHLPRASGSASVLPGPSSGTSILVCIS